MQNLQNFQGYNYTTLRKPNLAFVLIVADYFFEYLINLAQKSTNFISNLSDIQWVVKKKWPSMKCVAPKSLHQK